jgi:hypothetical protein
MCWGDIVGFFLHLVEHCAARRFKTISHSDDFAIIIQHKIKASRTGNQFQAINITWSANTIPI